MVQYYVFPKIFGLVERGWNAYPEWSPVPNDDKQALYEKARAIYNAKIAEIELPRLAADGFNFRVAQPGIKIVEGKLYANSPIPQANRPQPPRFGKLLSIAVPQLSEQNFSILGKKATPQTTRTINR